MTNDALYRQLMLRLDHIEEHLARLAAGIGYPYERFYPQVGSGMSPEVLQLVYSGNKIAAIKLYRELTGADLREAKRVIDGLSR
jgi:hypothetical protein